jgi:hypothetical protein
MMPLFGKERQKQPSEDTGAVRPSGKGPLARIRARLPWGACAQWLRVLSVAFGVVLALIIVAVLPISGVHALFTAKSETAINVITISDDFSKRSGPLSIPSPEDEDAEATEDATDVGAESGESEEESEDASETGDESEESAGPSVKQPEGASGTDSSPAKPSRDAAASSEQTTPPTASPSTDTSAEKGEKVVSGAPKAMDTGGGSDDG